MKTLRNPGEWWRARDRREQWMLATMFVMLAAFIYWYGLLAPLRHLRASAQDGYDRAAADVLVTRALAAELRGVRARRVDGPGREALLESAAEAGIAISRQRGDAAGALSLGIDSVRAGPLFAWLTALRQTHGIAPQTLHVEKRDGALQVEVSFATGEGPAAADRDAAGDRSGSDGSDGG